MSEPSPNIEQEVYQGLNVKYTPAPLGKRILAYVTDMSIIGAASYVLVFVGMFLGIGAGAILSVIVGEEEDAGAAIALLAIIITFLLISFVSHAYFVYYEYKKGMTLGKKIFGLRVISKNGGKLTLGQCVLRETIRYIDVGLVIPGLLSTTISESRQRLGDMAAGTLVTHSAAREDRKNFLYVPQDRYMHMKAALHCQPIPSELKNHYLAFAYHKYIARKQVEPALEQQWVDQIRQYIKDSEEMKLNNEELLLFFGEYCNQLSTA